MTYFMHSESAFLKSCSEIVSLMQHSFCSLCKGVLHIVSDIIRFLVDRKWCHSDYLIGSTWGNYEWKNYSNVTFRVQDMFVNLYQFFLKFWLIKGKSRKITLTTEHWYISLQNGNSLRECVQLCMSFKGVISICVTSIGPSQYAQCKVKARRKHSQSLS